MKTETLVSELQEILPKYGNRDIEFCIVIGNKFYQQPIDQIRIVDNDKKYPFVVCSDLTHNTYVEIFRNTFYDKLNKLGKWIYRFFIKSNINVDRIEITEDFTKNECIKYLKWFRQNTPFNYHENYTIDDNHYKILYNQYKITNK